MDLTPPSPLRPVRRPPATPTVHVPRRNARGGLEAGNGDLRRCRWRWPGAVLVSGRWLQGPWPHRAHAPLVEALGVREPQGHCAPCEGLRQSRAVQGRPRACSVVLQTTDEKKHGLPLKTELKLQLGFPNFSFFVRLFKLRTSGAGCNCSSAKLKRGFEAAVTQDEGAVRVQTAACVSETDHTRKAWTACVHG